MIPFIKRMIIKYKELLLYVFFGIITTLINIVTFDVLYKMLRSPLLLANTAAWVIAFLFAFISNKLWVFDSKGWFNKNALKEMIGFLLARLGTLLLDTVIMWLFVDILWYNSLFSKTLSNCITILLNYLASKFFIFKRKDDY